MLIENTNMQIEAESADLLDRRLMALYGIRDGKPAKLDMFGPETLGAIEADELADLPQPGRRHKRGKSDASEPRIINRSRMNFSIGKRKRDEQPSPEIE